MWPNQQAHFSSDVSDMITYSKLCHVRKVPDDGPHSYITVMLLSAGGIQSFFVSVCGLSMMNIVTIRLLTASGLKYRIFEDIRVLNLRLDKSRYYYD